MNKFFILSVLLFLIMSIPQAKTFADTFELTGTIRDFRDSHPDFESFSSAPVNPGIVENTLGVDGKPVFVLPSVAGDVTTKANFDQWYRDVPGVNLSTPFTITLDNTITADPAVFTFIDNSFFPIDGELFGNEGRSHNYHFTYEINSEFTYVAGQTFRFRGDDDLWVFINDQLVIDIGGVHDTATASINLDTLSLTPGQNYSFDLFFAERHVTESNFRIDTSILLGAVPVPEPSTYLIMGSFAALFLFAKYRRVCNR
jgi:fibro-slime domain-containing protein